MIATVPELTDDPYQAENLRDPYGMHQRIREAGGMVWLSKYQAYATARYAPVYDALRDHDTYCSSAGVGLADFRTERPWRPPSLLLEADPPQHTHARSAMSAVLSVRALREFRPAFEAAAEQLVDALLERGDIDGIADLAVAFPLRVFPDAVGIAPEDRFELLSYGDLNFNSFGPRNDLLIKSQTDAPRLHAWMARACERDRLEPGKLGSRVWQLADSGEITADEAALLVRSLLTAGVDTTVSGFGNTLAAFLRHPAQWERLHADPRLARFAFDEAIRLESPVQTFYRTTTRATEIDGLPVEAGRKILLFLGGANRDPRRWGTTADQLDLDRDASGHVAFGMGIHHCVGQPMARLEAEILLTTLARRVRAIRPAGPAVPRLNNTLRGWRTLPLRLVPAS